MEDVLPKLDVLYMTRVQKERFFNEDDYIRMKDFYILDQSKMDLASPEMLVLHPDRKSTRLNSSHPSSSRMPSSA